MKHCLCKMYLQKERSYSQIYASQTTWHSQRVTVHMNVFKIWRSLAEYSGSAIVNRIPYLLESSYSWPLLTFHTLGMSVLAFQSSVISSKLGFEK